MKYKVFNELYEVRRKTHTLEKRFYTSEKQNEGDNVNKLGEREILRPRLKLTDEKTVT